MSNYAIYARIDGDGLVRALVNTQLMPEVMVQPGFVPAPEPDPYPPSGHAWRWVNGAWSQVPDLRGREYGNPAGTERVLITHVLQQPPQGWVLLDDTSDWTGAP